MERDIDLLLDVFGEKAVRENENVYALYTVAAGSELSKRFLLTLIKSLLGLMTDEEVERWNGE
jgi:hypothetical protein